MRFRWTFDDSAQTLRAPSGLSLSVREIATWVQDRLYNRHDLTGPWAGWRVRGRWLIGPKGLRVTPQMLRDATEKAGLAGRHRPGE